MEQKHFWGVNTGDMQYLHTGQHMALGVQYRTQLTEGKYRQTTLPIIQYKNCGLAPLYILKLSKGWIQEHI